MIVGVVGLGLIGGSLAKVYKESGHTVFGYDTDNNICSFAEMSKVTDGILDDNLIKSCEVIFIAIYPKDTIAWLRENACNISSGTFVIDCCGVKREVCKSCFEIAEANGFTFIGGHPMAGSHYSGFKYSKSNMFSGAPMVIVPPKFDDIDLLDKIKTLLKHAGFGTITVTTAEKHDEMIAFTSDLPHIISNAYIKSPAAKNHKGFSAGSYKDLTRVAWLSSEMWSELFIDNKDFLINELNEFINSLEEYKKALINDDKVYLRQLLEEGKNIKEKVDGR